MPSFSSLARYRRCNPRLWCLSLCAAVGCLSHLREFSHLAGISSGAAMDVGQAALATLRRLIAEAADPSRERALSRSSLPALFLRGCCVDVDRALGRCLLLRASRLLASLLAHAGILPLSRDLVNDGIDSRHLLNTYCSPIVAAWYGRRRKSAKPQTNHHLKSPRFASRTLAGRGLAA